MPLFGGIFWLLILAGIVLVVWSYARRDGAPAAGGGDAPLEILKRRLARGEITREEYEAVKKELS
jgi:putative membrane protein